MTLLLARMRMCKPLFCLKHLVVDFIRNRFIYKMIRMVVYIVQTKAELPITKHSWRKTFFALYSSVKIMWFAVYQI